MKKQFATMLAATAVLGVTTAFAANPFSDVTPDSWAYQAVSQLAQAGIVNGYPDGTFKGQNNICLLYTSCYACWRSKLFTLGHACIYYCPHHFHWGSSI